MHAGYDRVKAPGTCHKNIAGGEKSQHQPGHAKHLLLLCCGDWVVTSHRITQPHLALPAVPRILFGLPACAAAGKFALPK